MKKQETKEEKKIEIKNYIMVVLIFIAITGITIYLCNVYNTYQESKLEIPVIRGTLSEITSEEIEHYTSENPTTILYICTPNNLTCRSYEKDLKKLVKKKELQNEIVYINIKEEEKENFIKKFNDTYKSRIKLNTNFPALVALEENETVHILQPKEQEKLTIQKTQQFIELHKIGE